MMKYPILFALVFIGFPLSALASDDAICTAEYAPVCGEVVRQCLVAPCESDRQTFGNLCMANAAAATNITTGACESDE